MFTLYFRLALARVWLSTAAHHSSPSSCCNAAHLALFLKVQPVTFQVVFVKGTHIYNRFLCSMWRGSSDTSKWTLALMTHELGYLSLWVKLDTWSLRCLSAIYHHKLWKMNPVTGARYGITHRHAGGSWLLLLQINGKLLSTALLDGLVLKSSQQTDTTVAHTCY